MKPDVAEKLSLLFLQINSNLNDSVALVRDTGGEGEFNSFRRGIGNIMAEVIEVAEKIYQEHPSLRPEALNGPYKVDSKIFEPRFYRWYE